MNVIESSGLACCSSNAGDDKPDNKSQSVTARYRMLLEKKSPSFASGFFERQSCRLYVSRPITGACMQNAQPRNLKHFYDKYLHRNTKKTRQTHLIPVFLPAFPKIMQKILKNSIFLFDL